MRRPSKTSISRVIRSWADRPSAGIASARSANDAAPPRLLVLARPAGVVVAVRVLVVAHEVAPRGPGGELEVEVLLGEGVESSATDRTSAVGRLGMLEPMLVAGAPCDQASRPGDTARMTDATTLPLVEQLRFTRSEFRRGLRGTPEADAVRRLEPMNSIGWIVAHMAWHEQRYWLTRGPRRDAAAGAQRDRRERRPGRRRRRCGRCSTRGAR